MTPTNPDSKLYVTPIPRHGRQLRQLLATTKLLDLELVSPNPFFSIIMLLRFHMTATNRYRQLQHGTARHRTGWGCLFQGGVTVNRSGLSQTEVISRCRANTKTVTDETAARRSTSKKNGKQYVADTKGTEHCIQQEPGEYRIAHNRNQANTELHTTGTRRIQSYIQQEPGEYRIAYNRNEANTELYTTATEGIRNLYTTAKRVSPWGRDHVNTSDLWSGTLFLSLSGICLHSLCSFKPKLKTHPFSSAC